MQGEESGSASMAEEYEHEVLDIEEIARADLNTAADLLNVLKLSRWTSTFEEECMDLQTLFYVQDEQLMTLGLTISERITLLRCIQLFKDVPPPPASMVMKWKKEAPPRPVARTVRFEEKVEEVRASSLGINNEDRHIPEDATDIHDDAEQYQDDAYQNDDQEALAAGAMGMVTGDEAEVAEIEFQPCHSRVYICCENSEQIEQIGDALQAAFEDDLGLDSTRVKFLVPSEPAHILRGLETTLHESSYDDDLLWIVLAFNGSDGELVPGVSFSELVEAVERQYKGRRVIFIVDSCIVPELNESDTSLLNDQLELALLYTVSPITPNPCFLCLCLVDALRGNVFREPNVPFTLKKFVDDGLDTVRFASRCLGLTETVSEYIATPRFVDEDLAMCHTLEHETNMGDQCGKRGLYAERPVQVIGMNGNERMHLRFLDGLSDPEWVDSAEVTILESESEDLVEQVELQEEEESGRDIPLPVPAAALEEEEGESGRDIPLPRPEEDDESGRDMPLPVPPVEDINEEVQGEVAMEEPPIEEAQAIEELLEETPNDREVADTADYGHTEPEEVIEEVEIETTAYSEEALQQNTPIEEEPIEAVPVVGEEMLDPEEVVETEQEAFLESLAETDEMHEDMPEAQMDGTGVMGTQEEVVDEIAVDEELAEPAEVNYEALIDEGSTVVEETVDEAEEEAPLVEPLDEIAEEFPADATPALVEGAPTEEFQEVVVTPTEEEFAEEAGIEEEHIEEVHEVVEMPTEMEFTEPGVEEDPIEEIQAAVVTPEEFAEVGVELEEPIEEIYEDVAMPTEEQFVESGGNQDFMEAIEEPLVEEQVMEEPHELTDTQPDDTQIEEDVFQQQEEDVGEIEPMDTEVQIEYDDSDDRVAAVPALAILRTNSVLSEHSSTRDLAVPSIATMEELEEMPIDEDMPDMDGITDIEPAMDMLHEDILLDDDLVEAEDLDDEAQRT